MLLNVFGIEGAHRFLEILVFGIWYPEFGLRFEIDGWNPEFVLKFSQVSGCCICLDEECGIAQYRAQSREDVDCA